MESNELRIGNWVETPVTGCQQVVSLGIDEMEAARDFALPINTCGKYSEYAPIPLTPEWLERLGAKEKKVPALPSEWVFVTESIELSWSPDRPWEVILFIVNSLDSIQIDCEHVHQLQNLYFALTGEELTWQESPAQ